ncbi:MAG: hypothetical protein V4547_18925 [Bacteroidota bacterium]
MFEKLTNKTKRLKLPTVKEIFRELFLDKEFTALIKRLNTEGEQTSQLIYGVDSKDRPLDEIGGEYSPYTVMLKKDKGQITDHVTLKDTGYFYSSFKTFWRNDKDGAIQITADTIKEGGDDLITRWGKDIIGLDETNLGVLREYAKKKLGLIISNYQKNGFRIFYKAA